MLIDAALVTVREFVGIPSNLQALEMLECMNARTVKSNDKILEEEYDFYLDCSGE